MRLGGAPPSMKQLSAILFDVDDTLYSTTAFVEMARANAVAAMIRAGLKMDRVALSNELQAIVTESGSNYERHFDALLERLPEDIYRPVNPAMIVSAGVIAYHDTKVRELAPFGDAVEILRWLHDRGTPLIGVVSSGVPVKQAEKVIRLGLDEYVDPGAIFITEQMGLPKQDPGLYDGVCKSLGVEPGSCMYVGDNPANDIDPPNHIGMITVLVRRGGKYSHIEPKTAPDFTIRDFWELRDILAADFDIS